MSQKLGEIYVELNAKDKKFKNRLNKLEGEVKTSGSKLGRIFSNSFASVLGTTAIFYGFTRAIKQTITLAQRQIQAEKQVEQAIRTTGGTAGYTAKELYKMASSLQKLTGIGDEDILKNVTNNLLTFKNISGDIFKRTQRAILDVNAVISQGNIGALTSQAIQLGKALNDPITGLSALTRVGITFSQSQKDIIKNLVEQGKLYEAQALMLREIEGQYSGQAKALNEATGGLKGLASMWGDLQEKIGIGIIKGIKPAVKLLSDYMETHQKDVQNYADGVQKYISVVIDSFKALYKIIDKVKSISEGFGKFFNWLSNKSGVTDVMDFVSYPFRKITGVDFKKETKGIREIKDAQKEVVTEIKKEKTERKQINEQVKNSLANLKTHLNNLKDEFEKTPIGSKHWYELSDAIDKATAELQKYDDELEQRRFNKQFGNRTGITGGEISGKGLQTQPFNNSTDLTTVPSVENVNPLYDELDNARDEFFEREFEAWKQHNQALVDTFSVLEQGYNLFWATLNDKNMTGKERMELVWEQIKQSFYRLVGDMVKEWAVNQIKMRILGDTTRASEIAKAGATGGAIASAYAPAAAYASIMSFGGADAIGASGLASTVALAQTLAIPKFSQGGDFVVPPGYSNDSYLMRVQSGEHVTVTPQNSTTDQTFLLGKISNGIEQLKNAMIKKDTNVIIENSLEGLDFQRKVLDPIDDVTAGRVQYE